MQLMSLISLIMVENQICVLRYNSSQYKHRPTPYETCTSKEKKLPVGGGSVYHKRD